MIDSRLIHLRSGQVREWSSFPEQADAVILERRFEARKNQAEAALRLRQQDVKQVVARAAERQAARRACPRRERSDSLSADCRRAAGRWRKSRCGSSRRPAGRPVRRHPRRRNLDRTSGPLPKCSARRRSNVKVIDADSRPAIAGANHDRECQRRAADAGDQIQRHARRPAAASSTRPTGQADIRPACRQVHDLCRPRV